MFLILYFSVVLLATGAIKANDHHNKWKICDKLGVHFYNELGCTPNYDQSQTCPTSYTCKDYVLPNGKCLFQGKVIDNYEYFNASGKCNTGLQCHAETNQKRSITRGVVTDCSIEPIKPGCYARRSPLDCCRGEEICPEHPADVAFCNVDNQRYKDGDWIAPEGTCWDCTCQPGFELFKEPFCIRQECNLEFHHAEELEKKCAPVYKRYQQEDGLCCPRSYICPEDIIKDTPITTSDDSKDKCSFGDKTYNIGDQIEVVYNGSKICAQETRICTCLLPPYLSCQ